MATLIRQRGWTVIEIMVVVMVVAILMAIAAPNYKRIRERSRIAEAEAQVEILHAAIAQLAWDTGRWPGAIERNAASSTKVWDLAQPIAGLLDKTGQYHDWEGPYLERIPLDPWDNPYFFDAAYQHQGQSYPAVGSFGPNGAGRGVYDADNIFRILK